MLKKYAVNSEVVNHYWAKWVLASALLLSSNSAFALTADDVLNKMETDERTTFLAGVVGGLAYSRYLRDKPDQSGMSCFYNWYYENGVENWPKVEKWLSRHLDKPIEPLIYILVKKECGE